MLTSPKAWAGILLVIVGLVWLFQGLGLLGGSVMTGLTLWAVVGPVVAALGVALIVSVVRTDRP